MYLKAIHVENFRNLRDFQLNLQPGLNVLVGRNNMGKSNLLSAIRLALGPSSARNEALWLTEDDFYRVNRTTPREEIIRVSLEFAGLSENERAQFFEIAELNLSDLAKSTANINFEGVWRPGDRRPQIRRWGGPAAGERNAVPHEILEQIPLTFLPALRDAEAALAPGPRSRLAPLLRDRATRDDEKEIVDLYTEANVELGKTSLVTDASSTLQESAESMAGADYRPPAIEAAPAEFEKILRSLNVVVGKTPIASLSAIGLGIQNVIYISTILAHLEKAAETDCPLLLVEEPEAHLHPQLTVLLGEYLGRTRPGTNTPQALVTTHSPTLAAHVRPMQVCVLYEDEDCPGSIIGNAVADAGLDDTEERFLQRMLDVTRATLYFARGLILVERVSEQLLIPVLARRLGKSLRDQQVSVVPICGVSFGTFEKLLSDECFAIPVAIVTDSDPPVIGPGDAAPKSELAEDQTQRPWTQARP
jgi:putative ATP-dependent endonuclease of OLD family